MRRVRLLFQEGNLHVLHQEQGLRRSSDADPGRRCRRGRRDRRHRRHPVGWRATPSTSTARCSVRTTARVSCWTCCVRARRSASRSSCSAPANYDPAEDFILSYQGLVSDFFTAGLVSASTELHYGGGSTAGEWRNAPLTTPRGRSSTRLRRGERPVRRRRQHRGAGGQGQPPAVWRHLQDRLDRGRPTRRASRSGQLRPADNGSNTNFSQPFVLTYPSSGVPDRQAAAAAVHHQPHRFLQQGLAQPDRCEQQPAVGRRTSGLLP